VNDDDDCALFSHFVVRAELAETKIPMDPSEVFTAIRFGGLSRDCSSELTDA